MGDSFANDVRALDPDTPVTLVRVVPVVNVIGSVPGTENLREAGISGARGIMGGLNTSDMDESQGEGTPSLVVVLSSSNP